MKNNGVLKTFLDANNRYQMADLVRITPIIGDPILMTNADRDITFTENAVSVTYLSSEVGFIRSNTSLKVGVEVDEMNLTLFNLNPAYAPISNESLVSATIKGYFDNAQVIVQRAFFPNVYGTTSADYVVWLFTGSIHEANPSRNSVSMSVKSELDKLNMTLPRNTYQPSCVNTLYDSNCRLNDIDFTQSATVVSYTVSTNTLVINLNGTARSTDRFNLGTVIFTQGNNQYAYRQVKTSTFNSGTQHTIVLTAPFPYSVEVGQTLNIKVGCDKSATGLNGCLTKNNSANFRGFPDIPRNENAI
jgi:uncharacterized phage protein (TIGR02218 family)